MMKWSKKTYLFMKWLQRIFLPAAMGLSAGICVYIGAEVVAGGIGAIGGLLITFIGAITAGAEYEYDLEKKKKSEAEPGGE